MVLNLANGVFMRNKNSSQNHAENDPQDSRSKTNYSQNPKTIKNRPSPQIHQQRLPISKQVHHSQARFWKNPTPTAGSMDPEAICLGEFHKDVEVLDILLQHRLSKRLWAKFQPLGEVSSNCAECFPTCSARFSKMAWHFGMIPRHWWNLPANEVTEWIIHLRTWNHSGQEMNQFWDNWFPIYTRNGSKVSTP